MMAMDQNAEKIPLKDLEKTYLSLLTGDIQTASSVPLYRSLFVSKEVIVNWLYKKDDKKPINIKIIKEKEFVISLILISLISYILRLINNSNKFKNGHINSAI